MISLASSKPQVYYREYRELGCPEFNQFVTVHIPHPYDCGKYLVCLSRSVMEQTCPSNLYFNLEKKMCDYPHNVKCETEVVHYDRNQLK